MPVSNLVLLAVVIILLSVLGIIIFSKRERSSTKRHQEIANYRYRAEQAQEFHDKLSLIGLSKVVYRFLLERVVANIELAFAIDSNYPGLKSRLESAKDALADMENTQYYTELPTDSVTLHNVISRMNKLVQYVNTLYEKRIIQDSYYQQLLPLIHESKLRLTVEGNLTVGNQCLYEGHVGTAKQCYSQAKSILLAQPGEDIYVQEQLLVVEDCLTKVSGVEADELNPVETAESIEDSDENSDLEQSDELQTIDDKIRDAALEQAELNRLNEETGGHEVKKKW